MSEEQALDRRTKVYKDLVSLMPRPTPEIEESIDGEDFRYLPEPRCRVCTAGDQNKQLPNGAEVQDLVDALLLYPKSVADIFRSIEPMMDAWPPKTKITYKSIRTHLNKHLSWDRRAMRLMVERWAQEKGMSIMDAAGRMILTEEAWLEATAQFGWNRLITGQLEPSWAETQKAFERIGEIKQQAEGEYSIASLLAQLNSIIQVIREEIPPDRWDHVVERIRGVDVDRDALPMTVEGSADEFEEIMAEQSRLAGEEETQ